MKNTSKTFTLIEAIIVVGVLSILLSTLIPSFQGARERAFDATCKSNLKQYGYFLTNHYVTTGGDFPVFAWITTISDQMSASAKRIIGPGVQSAYTHSNSLDILYFC